MPELSSAVVVPLSFAASLLVLAWLSHQISIHIQIPVYYGTRSRNAPTIVLFLVFLPGVFIHEGAHWLMAKLCGLKTGKFRVWPKRQGTQIGLGSVSVEKGGPLIDALVGMAPLIVGTLLIGLISHFIFGADRLADEVATGGWRGGLNLLHGATRVPDALLWAYLLFTISNAMMPSPSDREPLKPVALYGIVAVVLYLLLGLPRGPIADALAWALPTLQALTSAFAFTILLDGAVLAALFLIRQLIRM